MLVKTSNRVGRKQKVTRSGSRTEFLSFWRRAWECRGLVDHHNLNKQRAWKGDDTTKMVFQDPPRPAQVEESWEIWSTEHCPQHPRSIMVPNEMNEILRLKSPGFLHVYKHSLGV